MKTETMRPRAARAALCALWAGGALAALSGCGGGGGEPAPGEPPLAASGTYAQQCAPTNHLAPAPQRTGSLSAEKGWLRSTMDESYLWYDEVPTVNASSPAFSGTANVAASMDAYFEALLTPRLTASGKPLDRFSFTYPTAQWQALIGSGVEHGYGVEWAYVSTSVPREVRVATVLAGTPAASAGLRRGDRLVSVDSVDVATGANVDAINAGLQPDGEATHTMMLERVGGSRYVATMTSTAVTRAPVPLVRTISTATGKVGYVVFNDHNEASEAALIAAFQQLKADGVSDLVLDMRYNGGGYLYIASQLAYMVAGSAATAGKTFEKLNYSAKRTADNARPPIPFIDFACLPDADGYCTSGQPLPTLALPRMYVIVGRSTCSASESVVNGLRGVDVDVHLIGGTTCGKPYGFAAKDNCGISYFPIEFTGVNHKGFGDYADGFAPGCAAADDFSHEIGDDGEGLLVTALGYRATGVCSPAGASSRMRPLAAGAALEPRLLRRPIRDNRFLRPLRF